MKSDQTELGLFVVAFLPYFATHMMGGDLYWLFFFFRQKCWNKLICFWYYIIAIEISEKERVYLPIEINNIYIYIYIAIETL